MLRRKPLTVLVSLVGLGCLLGLLLSRAYIYDQVSRWACRFGLDSLVSEQCYIDRANIARDHGQIGDALAYLTKAVALNPDDDKLYLQRGICYAYKSRFEAAISDFTKVIVLKPTSAAPYLLRGLAYTGEGLYGKAIIDETKALSLDPRYSFFAYAARGAAQTWANRPEAAIIDLSNAITLQPASSFAYYTRAIAYDESGAHDRAKGDYVRALALLNAAIVKAPRDGLSYEQRGLVFGRLGREGEAIDDETHALALHCLGPADAYVYRSLAYDSEGQHGNAAADLQSAIQINMFAKLEWDAIKRSETTP